MGRIVKQKKRMSGLSNPMKNPEIAATVFKKNSIKLRIPVNQFTKDGKTLIKEWAGIVDAAKELGIQGSGIIRVCKKVAAYKSAGGFYWEYKNEQKLK